MTDSEKQNNNHDRWNIFSLKEYFDYAMYTLKEKFEDDLHNMDEKHTIIVTNNKDTLNAAKESMERRLNGMNQIREQLNDQAKTFLRIDTFESKHELILNKVESLQKIVWAGVGIVLFIQVIIGVVILAFKK